LGGFVLPAFIFTYFVDLRTFASQLDFAQIEGFRAGGVSFAKFMHYNDLRKSAHKIHIYYDNWDYIKY